MLNEPIYRRSFLTLVWLAGVSITVTFPRLSNGDYRDCLLRHFSSRADLAALGSAFLAERPNLRQFETAVFYQALAHRVGVSSERPHEILLSIPAAVANDFECGATENIRGWEVSRTEFLLALLAASHPEAA